VLEEISIRGLGVIESATLELGPGLTVLTGETGAGKTMVMTGLALLLGGRGDAALVRPGATKLVVEGRVTVKPAVAARVAEAGGELDDDVLTLGRTVGADGRSRAQVGGRSAPVALLGELAEHLIAVHGQHDQQHLLRPARQRELVDQHGGAALARTLTAYQECHHAWRDVVDRLAELSGAARERAREADGLRLALEEIGELNPQPGEDTTLAATVDGIDVIVSGHTHDTLAQPKVVTTPSGGTTLIVTAGSYTMYLGVLNLTVTPAATAGGQATVALDDYTLQSIDDTIPGDATTQATVDALVAGVDLGLMPSGLSYKKVMASTAFDLTLPPYTESTVGNLVTDAYRKVVGAVQPTEPPDLAVEANGQLRGGIAKGKTGQIWFEDLFRVTPLGIGPDKVPGFPLVTFYLNAKDIASGLELGAAGPPTVADQYFLQISGLKVTYDMTKPVFGRVTGLTLTPDMGAPVPMNVADTTKCYKVVSTAYVAGLLGVVKSFTQGLLSVDAKAKDCTTKIDPTAATSYVDADPTSPTTTEELHAWQAVAKYITMFPDTNADTIPDVPAPLYMMAQGRITKQ